MTPAGRALALAGVALAVALGGTGAASGGPAPSWAKDEACRSCHVEAARTWAASRHHASASNDAYSRAVAVEPLPFCRACHAPHGDPSRETEEPARALGITCIDCHLRGGRVLAAPRAEAAPVEAPHPVSRDASLRTRACAGCHEFDFPDGRGERMQRTGTEHAESPWAGVTCAECHMPRDEAGRHDHGFDVSRNAALLARAVRVEARRGASGARATFVIEPVRVGHAFPTGDLFRRLTLTVRGARTVRRFFLRQFAADARPSAALAGLMEQAGAAPGVVVAPRREVRDTRLRSRAEVTVDLGETSAEVPLSWSLVYERVDASPTSRPEDAVVSGSVPLASGVLDPVR